MPQRVSSRLFNNLLEERTNVDVVCSAFGNRLMLFQHMPWGQVDSLRKSQDTWRTDGRTDGRTESSLLRLLYYSGAVAAAAGFTGQPVQKGGIELKK